MDVHLLGVSCATPVATNDMPYIAQRFIQKASKSRSSPLRQSVVDCGHVV